MPRVVRGNVVLYVRDDEIQHYLALGYNVTDSHGTVTCPSIPTDVGTLQKHYIESNQRVAVLENEVALLTAEIEMLKASRTRKAKSE